ncbi:MAG: LamG domain-containing protein, partial [Erythrobacter sp.]|nr:LamG domain-containing protein [Erythrobacter sp.]
MIGIKSVGGTLYKSINGESWVNTALSTSNSLIDYLLRLFYDENNSTTSISQQLLIFRGGLDDNEINTLYNGGFTRPFSTLPTAMTVWSKLMYRWDLDEQSGDRVDKAPVILLPTFDGGTDKVDFGADLTFGHLNADCTFSLWFNAMTLTGNQGLIGKFQNPNEEWLVYFNGTTLTVLTSANGTSNTTRSTTTVTKGLWYHLALTYSNTTNELKVYLNGNLESTTNIGGSTYEGTEPFTLGSYSGGNYFDGHILDVMYFTETLTSEAVEVLYNAGNRISPDDVLALPVETDTDEGLESNPNYTSENLNGGTYYFNSSNPALSQLKTLEGGLLCTTTGIPLSDDFTGNGANSSLVGSAVWDERWFVQNTNTSANIVNDNLEINTTGNTSY